MSVHEFDKAILANPEIFEQNRLEPHSDHLYYANEKELFFKNSSFIKSLNGTWRFTYCKNVEAFNTDFVKEDFDDSAFDFIEVPGHFETQGFGHNHYTNNAYPWDGNENVMPGQIPSKFNPVGSYIREFTVPENFNNTFICFSGVDSAFALWVNGKYVGYSEDSCTPAEFELTPYLKSGTNRLCVAVFKFTSGSWLEDQDFFRFSGIFRDVFLFTKPKAHVNDLEIKTTLHDNYTKATVNVLFKLEGEGKVELTLTSPKGDVVGTYHGSNEICFDVEDAMLWSAEKPNLYSALIKVYTKENELSEVILERIGLREFKLIDKVMCLNGKRVIFNGVNRHEFSATKGRAGIDESEMRRDLMIMKDLNINALRTCHYPNSSALYRLCDEIGLYVIDEVNLETHGTWQALGIDMPDNPWILPKDHKEWREAVLARGKAMVERDKNHAAIVIFSCGNEAFGGSIIYELSNYLRERADDRLVHYEGLFHDRSYNDSSDMESQMYSTVEYVKNFLKDHREKPFIMCEYTHAMGNSCGGMKLYTDLTKTEPLFQGGFIWDFVDQAIYRKDNHGHTFLGYGGDFDDFPNDGNFSGNGIVFADRSLTPKCAEVKFNYQPFTLEVLEDSVTITNYNLFTNLNEYDLKATLKINGKIVKEQILGSYDLAPSKSMTISLNGFAKDLFDKTKEEGIICVSVLRKPGCEEELSRELAFGEAIFGNYEAPRLKSTKFEIVNGFNNVGIRGKNFSYMFSKGKGFLISAKRCNQEIMRYPMQLNFFRAPIDNDVGNKMSHRLGAWKIAGEYSTCVGYNVKEDSGVIKIAFDHKLGGTKDTIVKVIYSIDATGELTIELDYKKSNELPDEMMVFGFELKVKEELNKLCYYAKGPTEGYNDRDNGLKLSIYESEVSKEYVPYLKPQECGNHTKSRYVALTNSHNHGLFISMVDNSFEFSALPYSSSELENAMHIIELPQPSCTHLRINAVQAGIGGDDSWGANILEKYRLQNQDRNFKIKLRLI